MNTETFDLSPSKLSPPRRKDLPQIRSGTESLVPLQGLVGVNVGIALEYFPSRPSDEQAQHVKDPSLGFDV